MAISSSDGVIGFSVSYHKQPLQSFLTKVDAKLAGKEYVCVVGPTDENVNGLVL
jgi:hypothetical protein